jgi:hypothetical protein
MLSRPDYSRWQALVNVPLPRWIPVRQVFDSPQVADVAAAVRQELARPEIRAQLRPGQHVALGVGSRSQAALPTLVGTTVAVLREVGCHPFIVPAMGSHGGATGPGQASVLAHYGVKEETVGAPVRSSMEVVEIGRLANGMPVYFDRLALGADLVIPINRIKPHTAFRGPIESGVLKMMVIGFGKHAGATSLHGDGFPNLSRHLLEAYRITQAKTPFRFGLATVENAAERVAHVEAILAPDLVEREAELLQLAWQWMAQLKFDQVDVLVVHTLGKNLSGSGMDPNVTGRYSAGLPGRLKATRIAVLDLTPETAGNANGIGMADVITERVARQIDLDATWINALTSTLPQSVRLPVFMANDRMAIQLAIKTCNRIDPQAVRFVYIRSTLDLEQIRVSEAVWREIEGRAGFEAAGALGPIRFDTDGNLAL